MRESEHFNLNLVEGSDIVNPLVTDVPNYESIDEQMFKNQNAGVQNATELKTGTIHAITRLVPDAQVITFTATSNFVAGDTFTVDGIQVSALTVSGEQLPTGAYVINSQVLAILKGTLLTVYGVGSDVADNALALNGHPDTYFGTKDEVDNAIDTANAANVLATDTNNRVNANSIEITKNLKDGAPYTLPSDGYVAVGTTSSATDSDYVSATISDSEGKALATIRMNGVSSSSALFVKKGMIVTAFAYSRINVVSGSFRGLE